MIAIKSRDWSNSINLQLLIHLKLAGGVPFSEKLIKVVFLLRGLSKIRFVKKSFAGWQKYWQRFVDLEQKTKD